MEMVIHEEEAEISVVYENLCEASARSTALQRRSGEDREVPAAVPGETQILQLNIVKVQF